MGTDGDLPVSLPSPPPPRPAARREAIEAALRKFDGIEEPPARPARPRFAWAAMHRRPAGALVAAALIAVVAIPVIQSGLPDRPAEVASDEAGPIASRPSDNAPAAPASAEAPRAEPGAIVAGETAEAPAQAPASPPAAADERIGFASAEPEQKAAMAAPPPMAAAPAPLLRAEAPPPPPPPPPPPAEAAQEKADADAAGSIVVTGTRASRSKVESPSPVTVIDPYADFLSRLHKAARANDRRAMIRLVGFPLAVDFNGDIRTYRSAQDVERDYDRIFTPAVRAAALSLQADELQDRNGGRLKGNSAIWFGCGLRSCPSDTNIRIREISVGR